MSDLYRHDIQDGESPDAYMRMKWLTHHRYLVPVERCEHGVQLPAGLGHRIDGNLWCILGVGDE